ncbi:MAG: hypothetical protein QW270_06310 [Candidatus Bathyarchaeia archaeon]
MVLESVLTAVITVIIGVAVCALSQMVLKFVIEPIHKLDEIRGNIAHSLIYYADVYANPGMGTPKHMEASEKFRQQASLLLSRTHLIRNYWFFSRIGLIPNMQNVMKAHANLIGLSNGVHVKRYAEQNNKWADKIRKFLEI